MVLSPRLIIPVMVALTLASAVSGLYIYASHISPLKALDRGEEFGEILDRLSALTYSMEWDGRTLTVRIANNPQERAGVIEVYEGGDLLYVLEYSYESSRLTELRRVYPGGFVEDLDPLAMEEAFLTNMLFNETVEGQVTGLEAFPGIAPIYFLHYITRAINIDWSAFYSPRAAGAPLPLSEVNVDFSKVRLGDSEIRGVSVSILPSPAFFTPSKWGVAGVQAQVAVKEGLVVAVSMVIEYPLGEREVRISINVVELSSSS